MIIEENKSLKAYNTFGIDVQARRFVSLREGGDFVALLQSGLLREHPFLVLGGGSNVVFTGDYAGVVVHPENRGIRLLERDGGALYVEAAAGEVWDDFVRYCVAQGWHGVENLAAIPGTVGAAPVQNVGAYGVEAKDVVWRVHYFDVTSGEEHWLEHDECHFGYRHSRFKEESLRGTFLIDRVVFRLEDRYVPNLQYKALSDALSAQGIESPSAEQMVETVTAVRHSKLPDPKEVGSAGSFFKNPVVERAFCEQLKQRFPDLVAHDVDEGHCKLAAGWLIDQCGWKGRDLGRAGVYEKQALVLVNRGGCSGADVMRLAQAVIADVESRFGVMLIPEAIMV